MQASQHRRRGQSHKDCVLSKKKVAPTPERKDTMQRWYNWLHGMKKDEEKVKEKSTQKLVSCMTASVKGGSGLLRQNHANIASATR